MFPSFGGENKRAFEDVWASLGTVVLKGPFLESAEPQVSQGRDLGRLGRLCRASILGPASSGSPI